MKRWTFLASLSAASIAKKTTAPKRSLRVGVDTLATNLDPYATDVPGIDEYAWIFGDGLSTGERDPRPALADLPAVYDRGRTFRYHLRPFRWHDGTELRAAHVVDAIDALHRSHSSWLTYEPYSLIQDIAVRAPQEVDVRLQRASAAFSRRFFSPYAHPALPLLRHGADGMPIGTGPFRMVERNADRSVFVASSGSPRGRPASSALEVRIRPSVSSLGAELAAQQIDVAMPLARGMPYQERYRIEARHISVIVLLFNCAGTLRTSALRRAVLRALDITAIQRVFDSHAPRVTGVLPRGTPNDVPFPYPDRDVARARRELASLDGPLTMIYLSESRRYAFLALEIRQMLAEAGVAVELSPRPQLAYEAATGPLRQGRFDLAVSGLPYDENPDLSADWSCDNAAPVAGNFARFCDPDFDRAVRAQRVRAALQMLLDEVAFVPLAENMELFGIDRRVKGFATPSPFVPATFTVQRWVVPGETG